MRLPRSVIGIGPEELKTTLITAVSSGKPVQVDIESATDILTSPRRNCCGRQPAKPRRQAPLVSPSIYRTPVRAERDPPTRGENGGRVRPVRDIHHFQLLFVFFREL